MTYETRNGLQVIKAGSIVIDGTEHQVQNFYVKCNAALNGRAWNVTEKQRQCEKCFDKKQILGQLKLFD